MLVVSGLGDFSNPQALFLELSKYGRIVHYDHPHTIEKGITLDEAKDIFKGEQNPVKLNLFKKDGTIQSEFFPSYNSYQEQDPFK
jgi:hypothetical protein